MAQATKVDPRAEIEALVGYRGRYAGTDSERRAANHLARRLRRLGRDAEVEPTVVLPRIAATHLLHALVAVVGSTVTIKSPPIGAALALIATISAYGDLTGRFYLFRRLLNRRASQNVVSREGGDKPGLVVLLAHYDAARTGGLFRSRSVERRTALGQRLHRPFGLAEPFFLALVAVLVLSLVRLAVPGSTALGVVQLIPTVALILSMPPLIDLALGDVVPGANDNASGVATVLRLLERCGGRLEHFDVWAIFTGAEEAGAQGMREWVRRHRSELDPMRILFIDVDKVGVGTVRYATREGLILPLGYDLELHRLCREIADDDRESAEPRFGAREHVSRTTSGAAVARMHGLRAISVSCLNALDYIPHYHSPEDVPGRVEDASLERAFGFGSQLLERIDSELGPKL